MGMSDKLENVKDQAVGKAKQAVGQATDNTDLHAEGTVQQQAGEAGQQVEQAKDDQYDWEHKEAPRVDDVN